MTEEPVAREGIAVALTTIDEPPFRVPTQLTDLHRLLQAALALEHLTIPPYLTAMHTLRPGQNRAAFDVIRSVVLEEMLHMVLVANVLNALGGKPSVARTDFVARYPALLPFSSVPVALRHFSLAALDTFLRIEQPEHIDDLPAPDGGTSDGGWTSIGQFYGVIAASLDRLVDERGEAAVFTGEHHRQIGPEDFYDSGGEVRKVADRRSALEALAQVKEQGEGVGATVWDGDDLEYGEAREPAHYFRFNQLRAQRHYGPDDNPGSGPTGASLPVDWQGAYSIDPQAKAADFRFDPATHHAALEFNAAYAEMLVLLDNAFDGAPAALGNAVPQMVVLRDLAYALYRNPHPDPEKRARGLHASATFEITAAALQAARDAGNSQRATKAAER